MWGQAQYGDGLRHAHRADLHPRLPRARARSCSITLQKSLRVGVQPPTTASELNDIMKQAEVPNFLKPSLIDRLRQPAHNNHPISDEHLCPMIAEHHTAYWMAATNAPHFQIPHAGARPV
eukprot:6290594-Pyramimonas_sp.AAC.1